MKVRYPLYAKILFWFFANMLLMTVLIAGFFRFQFHMDMNSLAAGRAGGRTEVMAEAIRSELNAHPRAGSRVGWDAVLDRFGKLYGVRLVLFWENGAQAAGEKLEVPEPVHSSLVNSGLPGFPDEPPRQPVPASALPLGREGEIELPRGPKLVMHSENPSRYWILIRFPVIEKNCPPRMLTLVATSNSMNMSGLLFDFTVLTVSVGGALGLSALFWVPLVRSITRAVSQMTRATAEIAEGHFEVRVGERRHDELGSLGRGINQMAVRLEGLVGGQKRFLGDVAHELCSPIARTQMALGILEQRADEIQLPYLADLHEEVQTISNLVNDLLCFSKASLGASTIKLTSVALRPIVEKAIFQEAYSQATVDLTVCNTLWVLAEPYLLQRSIANLVRNAIRYAGAAGPISVTATRSVGKIALIVADSGPGVPETALPHIFDPFFRADPSRDRETGGVGLGLSIVRTCIEKCSGTVSCRNRSPQGFEVTVTLKIAMPPEAPSAA